MSYNLALSCLSLGRGFPSIGCKKMLASYLRRDTFNILKKNLVLRFDIRFPPSIFHDTFVHFAPPENPQYQCGHGQSIFSSSGKKFILKCWDMELEKSMDSIIRIYIRASISWLWNGSMEKYFYNLQWNFQQT